MTERFITPSKITAWLDCPHYLSLKHQVEDGLLTAPSGAMGAFARLLADKGLEHEEACLADYEARGLTVFVVPARQRGESFARWVRRVGNPMADQHDVIYQMPMVHNGIRGVADFLVKVINEDGLTIYEPVDAKLARKAAKPGHVLQLCFYADAIEAMTSMRPAHMHLWLGSGVQETLRVNDFGAYWRRLQQQLLGALDVEPPASATRPEPCAHCAFCEFADTCDDQWRGEDSLIYVAGLRSAERPILEHAGVATLTSLAEVESTVDGLRPERLARLTNQADLQKKAVEGVPPPFDLIPPSEDPVWGQGFATMPAPDHGDVFLDFEGHPFWRADRGLFFLFGLVARDEKGEWDYKTWWAHDPDEETAATEALIQYLAERRSNHPGMHIYHYNHTERSSLAALAEDRGVGEVDLATLIDTGAFVDLYLVVRNSLQVGAESYGLKVVEHLAGYERGHEIDAGAGAVLEYERYMATGSNECLDHIAAYNEDDVQATRALRDWLLTVRPEDLPFRAAQLEPLEDLPDLDARVAALHAYGTDTTQHFLGDLLGYWRRERLANLAPKLAACGGEVADLLIEPAAIAGLQMVGPYERLGKKGQPLKQQGMRFRFPPQDLSAFTGPGDEVVYARADERPGYSTIEKLDANEGQIDILWSDEDAELGVLPTVLIRNDWFRPRPKPEALAELATHVLDPSTGAANPVSLAMLRREAPRFIGEGGPPDGVFSDDLGQSLLWSTELDGSYVAMQGPPGTGKTFSGSHLIRHLLRSGKRVGITSFSHHAIDNLLEAVVALYVEAGDVAALKAVRKAAEPRVVLLGVTYAKDNAKAASPDFHLVAGTTWLFASGAMAAEPVDMLVIDEAGQLSLADAVAACRAARNVILLGDPLQLPQVAQASHPNGSGASVLEHALGEDKTIPAGRGVFLSETRRMHPDVCDFISQEIYEGRLTSHPTCTQQTTESGTGLRWLKASHTGCVTSAPEEADLIIAEIARLMGTLWTDQHGATHALATKDFLVVAPYNDQKNLLRALLDEDPLTRGVAVGTVDKFQGREAAVVFFTMTTSSGAEMHRSAEFLFSRNRINVAVSRARCLAFLVCTEALLNSRGRDVDEMRLISTLCAFVEASRLQEQRRLDRALPA